MPVLLLTLLIYGLGLVLTAVGSRLSGRCTTWCCALCGLPMWVVGGTVAPFCLALPQFMLAFLAAGLSITSLAVGTALAGAVAKESREELAAVREYFSTIVQKKAEREGGAWKRFYEAGMRLK